VDSQEGLSSMELVRTPSNTLHYSVTMGLPSAIQRHVVCRKSADVSEQHLASFLRIGKSQQDARVVTLYIVGIVEPNDYLALHARVLIGVFYPEDRGSMIFRNVD
jgi:hypothetical protein